MWELENNSLLFPFQTIRNSDMNSQEDPVGIPVLLPYGYLVHKNLPFDPSDKHIAMNLSCHFPILDTQEVYMLQTPLHLDRAMGLILGNERQMEVNITRLPSHTQLGRHGIQLPKLQDGGYVAGIGLLGVRNKTWLFH